MTSNRLVSDFLMEEAQSVLRLWREAEVTVSITDTVDYIRRVAKPSMSL